MLKPLYATLDYRTWRIKWFLLVLLPIRLLVLGRSTEHSITWPRNTLTREQLIIPWMSTALQWQLGKSIQDSFRWLTFRSASKIGLSPIRNAPSIQILCFQNFGMSLRSAGDTTRKKGRPFWTWKRFWSHVWSIYLRLFSYWQIITDGKARKRPSLTLSEMLAPPLPSPPTSIIYELRQRSSSSHVTNGGGTYGVFSHNLPSPPLDRVSLPPTTPLHRPISPNSRNVYRRYAISTWIKNVIVYAIGRCKPSVNHTTSMTIS